MIPLKNPALVACYVLCHDNRSLAIDENLAEVVEVDETLVGESLVDLIENLAVAYSDENSIDLNENLLSDYDVRILIAPAGNRLDPDVETVAAAAEVIPDASSAHLVQLDRYVDQVFVHLEEKSYAYPYQDEMRMMVAHQYAYRDPEISNQQEHDLLACYQFHHLTFPYRRFQQYHPVAYVA
jgi:predicted unusual protein kinase regulating ubiquinone biosynthesis (AarF/ABC1/UbiB family)